MRFPWTLFLYGFWFLYDIYSIAKVLVEVKVLCHIRKYLAAESLTFDSSAYMVLYPSKSSGKETQKTKIF